MAHDVFISYGREDAVLMQQVEKALLDAGLTIWTDKGIAPGSPSEAARRYQIKACPASRGQPIPLAYRRASSVISAGVVGEKTCVTGIRQYREKGFLVNEL